MSVVSEFLSNGNKEAAFSAYIATTEAEVEECQKLRFKVFSNEMGARIKTEKPGLDQDYFDQFCKHLYVRNNETAAVIATTRILTSENAKLAGRFYSQSEFNLENILLLNGGFLEIGRTCVQYEYRTGAAINTLWQGVFSLLEESDASFMFGCYSLPMGDSGRYVGALMNYLNQKYLAPDAYRVTPKYPVATARVSESLDAVLPSLLKRYLNMGAYVCGEPCLDRDFNTADLFILLDKSRVTKRYSRHFLTNKV